MKVNFLMINDEKMEVIVLASKGQSKKVSVESVQVGGTQIVPAEAVLDLGVVLDKTLSLVPHVNDMCRKAMFYIRNISSIRRYLTKAATEYLVHAFVTSRFCTDCHTGNCQNCRESRTMLPVWLVGRESTIT